MGRQCGQILGSGKRETSLSMLRFAPVVSASMCRNQLCFLCFANQKIRILCFAVPQLFNQLFFVGSFFFSKWGLGGCRGACECEVTELACWECDVTELAFWECKLESTSHSQNASSECEDPLCRNKSKNRPRCRNLFFFHHKIRIHPVDLYMNGLKVLAWNG